jgi:hypothetical protein
VRAALVDELDAGARPLLEAGRSPLELSRLLACTPDKALALWQPAAMPRCYPPRPEFGSGRQGERVVWEALRAALPDDAALLYSRWVMDLGGDKEIDFLVAWPGVGLAAIEVKGGHVERDSQDRWWSSRGQSRTELTQHPLVQAADAAYALQRWLASRGAGAARARMQHLLALPHMAVPQSLDPPDCPRRLVIDKDDLTRIDVVVKAAVHQGHGHAPLDEISLEELLALLTMQLPSQAALLSMCEEHEQQVVQLTRHQAETVRGLEAFTRIAVIGGAGTGKTWMALEQARLLAKDGKRVALVCYSRGLGRFLQRMTATWSKRPAYVGLFHDLALEWGAAAPTGDESDYYEQELPQALDALARTKPVGERFDAVVVDEAQDFGELWWPSLLQCLKDPDEGGVYVFMDQGQRVFSRQAEPPIALPPYKLRDNIRNTQRIAQVFGSLGTDQGKFVGMEGPPVRFVPCAPEEATDKADSAVDELLEQWAPGQVALLTTGSRHNLQKEVVDGHGWAAYWDAFFDDDEVFYGHVLGFKGLERPAVVLAVNGFKQPERAKEMLYVGLSRARTQLVVCGDLEELARVGGAGVRKRLQEASRWAL